MFDLYEQDYDDEMDGDSAEESQKRDLANGFMGGSDDEHSEEWDEVKPKERKKAKIVTRTPSSEQLASLGLKPGMNLVTFSVRSRL